MNILKQIIINKDCRLAYKVNYVHMYHIWSVDAGGSQQGGMEADREKRYN